MHFDPHNTGDKTNRSRRNYACKRRPWVFSGIPNLALISKRSIQDYIQESPTCQNCGFWPPEADTMNICRSNFTCQRTPCMYCLTSNLASVARTPTQKYINLRILPVSRRRFPFLIPYIDRNFRRSPPPWQISRRFHPIGATIQVYDPQNWIFLLRFDQNVEYKRLAGAYPLRAFHKICRVCI